MHYHKTNEISMGVGWEIYTLRLINTLAAFAITDNSTLSLTALRDRNTLQKNFSYLWCPWSIAVDDSVVRQPRQNYRPQQVSPASTWTSISLQLVAYPNDLHPEKKSLRENMGKENSCISNDHFLVEPNIKKMRSCKCAGNTFDWK